MHPGTQATYKEYQKEYSLEEEKNTKNYSISHLDPPRLLKHPLQAPCKLSLYKYTCLQLILSLFFHAFSNLSRVKLVIQCRLMVVDRIPSK